MPQGEILELEVGAWMDLVDHSYFDRIWAGKHYVDKKRIGIWGWVRGFLCGSSSPHRTNGTQSYGGFMSSKIAEANAGIHSLAMAVAVCSSLPVLSRRFPDARASLSLSRVGDCTVSAPS